MTFWQQLREAVFVSVRDQRNKQEARAQLSARTQFDSQQFATAYFPPEKRQIARRVWEIVRRNSVADITGIIPSDRFVEDLRMDDLDSMSLLELAIGVEKEFDVQIPDDRLAKIMTMGELIDEICCRAETKAK